MRQATNQHVAEKRKTTHQIELLKDDPDITSQRTVTGGALVTKLGWFTKQLDV